MHWTFKKSGMAVVSASAAFATWTSCDAGLFQKLFQKQETCEVPRRAPERDCSFGYFPTNWQPWNTCCEQTMAAGGGPGYAPVSAAPYDSAPFGESGEVILESGQPLQVPRPSFPGSQPGTIIAPPTESPEIESSIPVPSPSTDFHRSPAIADPVQCQLPLPPLHPANRRLPDPTLFPDGIRPNGGTPGSLPPVHDTATPQAPPPLPVTEPGTNSIRIPDPLRTHPPDEGGSIFVPPAPGTALFVPMRELITPSAGPLQPTSHTRNSEFDSPPRRHIHSHSSDNSEWRVMPGYYADQPERVQSTR